MKTRLLLVLLFLSSAFSLCAQSRFRGEWFAVRTPVAKAAALGYVRTLTWMTVDINGYCYGAEYLYDDTLIDTFEGQLSSNGVLTVASAGNVFLKVRIGASGRGSGTGKWTFGADTLRDTWMVFRERVR